MRRTQRHDFPQPKSPAMSDVAMASHYARRLVEYEQRRSGAPIKGAIAPVARKLRASNNAVFSLLFRMPKDVPNRLYSALEEAVSSEVAREIKALENELAAIRGGRRRLAPGTLEEVEAGLARLKLLLHGEAGQ
jgi:hypothetical protein